MNQIPPFHCLYELVYHSHIACPLASVIALGDRRAGMGGKVECLCCRELHRTQLKKGTVQGLLRRLKTWRKRLQS